MAGKYPFSDDIRDPNRKTPNPFAAEDPSLDEPRQLPEGTSEGTFTTSPHAQDEYRPVYQAVLPDRARMCMFIGSLGLLFSLTGWPSMMNIWNFAMFYLMPLLSLAGSLPAFLLGLSDVRAMRRGAMQNHRRQWAALACFLGALGVANSVVYLAIIIWRDWMGY